MHDKGCILGSPFRRSSQPIIVVVFQLLSRRNVFVVVALSILSVGAASALNLPRQQMPKKVAGCSGGWRALKLRWIQDVQCIPLFRKSNEWYSNTIMPFTMPRFNQMFNVMMANHCLTIKHTKIKKSFLYLSRHAHWPRLFDRCSVSMSSFRNLMVWLSVPPGGWRWQRLLSRWLH